MSEQFTPQSNHAYKSQKKNIKMSKGVGYGTRAFYNSHMYALDKHAKHVLCSKKWKSLVPLTWEPQGDQGECVSKN